MFDRAMEVAEAAPLQIQAEVMREEMENTEQWEYTTKSLPLLLHQVRMGLAKFLVIYKYITGVDHSGFLCRGLACKPVTGTNTCFTKYRCILVPI